MRRCWIKSWESVYIKSLELWLPLKDPVKLSVCSRKTTLAMANGGGLQSPISPASTSLQNDHYSFHKKPGTPALLRGPAQGHLFHLDRAEPGRTCGQHSGRGALVTPEPEPITHSCGSPHADFCFKIYCWVNSERKRSRSHTT